MAYIATLKVSASVRLEFTKRIFGNAEEGGRNCSAECNRPERNASNFHASAYEARRR
jgi:hypothetical protein